VIEDKGRQKRKSKEKGRLRRTKHKNGVGGETLPQKKRLRLFDLTKRGILRRDLG